MQLDQQYIDPLDKQLLNEIQWTFPLSVRPYLEIASKHGLTEDEVMRRISLMKRSGLIRQINAIFDTRKLGYKSALVAFAVKTDRLDSVASEVNKHPGVSHNYERDHEFNMWFTLAVPPDGDLKKVLEQMASLEGVIKFRLLPTLKLYKIGVKLDMVNNDPSSLTPDDNVKAIDQKKFELSLRDKEFIRELQKDLDVTPRPFDNSANHLGITVDELFKRAIEYESMGVMRRFAAILRHRDAGFTANGMIVWKVPDDKIDEVGYKLASFPQVSHCYRRPVYPDWPFNLFSMIHARTIEAAKKIAIELSNFVAINEYRILFSSREFKKERVKYFLD
jgi:DNA-binding Lrp family transcriptional regulator